jgi:hypothetical protein
MLTPSSATIRSRARPPDFSSRVILAGPETATDSPVRNSMDSDGIPYAASPIR